MDSYENQLIQDMKQAFKNLEMMVKIHFEEFMKRLIIKYKFQPFQQYFEDHEFKENMEEHITQLEISIVPLILHM